MWWASSNPLRAWIEQKGQGRTNCSLCLGWNIHVLLPLDIGALGSDSAWDLNHQACGSQAFGLGLNYTTGFPRSPACTGHIVALLASIIVWTNSCNKSLIYIYVYLFIYPIHSVSLENPDKCTTWLNKQKGEKRQIFFPVEFQLLSIDIPPLQEMELNSHSLLLEGRLRHSDSFPKNTVRKRKKQ